MAYDKKEREEVKQKKTEKYGKGEVFAVPALRSYPLTKDGKPNEERTMAAWKYLHQSRNEHKLTGEEFRTAESRIRSFAKKHFGKELEASDDRKEVEKSLQTQPTEKCLLPEFSLWPVTKGFKPDAELCNQAWQVIHMQKSLVLLGAENVDLAERRLLAYTQKYGIQLDDTPRF